MIYKNEKAEYYLVMKNLGKNYTETDYEVVTSKIEENVKVLKR